MGACVISTFSILRSRCATGGLSACIACTPVTMLSKTWLGLGLGLRVRARVRVS